MTETPNADPRSVVMRLVDALSADDGEAFVALLHPDVVWEVPGGDFLPGGDTYVGKEAMVRDLLEMAAGVFDAGSLRLDVRTVFVDGAAVIVEWVANATSHGRPYVDSTYCMVFVVQDGLVREAREYVDTRKVRAVLHPNAPDYVVPAAT